MQLNIESSAAMLFPEPAEIELDGDPFVVVELRIRDIGAIERAAATLAAHPLAGVKDHLVAAKALPVGDKARTPHLRAVMRARVDWPPRLGSQALSDVLATGPGVVAFLWVMLRRENPRLTPERCADLANRLHAGEWSEIHRVAWGHQPWEVFGDEDDAESGATASGRAGINWGAAVEALSVERKMSYEAIGEMYISQFLNMRCGGEPRPVTIADLD